MLTTQPGPSARRTGRSPSLGWRLGRIALAGSSRQAFLDHHWIDWLLRLAPARRRRSLALRILSLSPHYFIYQWERYPDEWTRVRILEAESARNRRSRSQIAAQILAPIIAEDAAVLDFGCGPGYLAGQVGELAREVVAVDVSSGTLACARLLNPGPSYRLNRDGRLPVADGSIDVVYSIAVFQHIDPTAWPSYFADFARVLRPGGRGVCHVAIAHRDMATYHQPGGLRGRYSLRFEEHRSDAVASALSGAGFVDVRVDPIDGAITIEDDVGRQHIATFRKPG